MFRELNEAIAGTVAGAIVGIVAVVLFGIESEFLSGALIIFCAAGGFLKEIVGDPSPKKRTTRKRR